MTPNIFSVLAQTLISRGDDAEEIARDLAHALKEVVDAGVGKGVFHEEVAYLLDPALPAPAHRSPRP